MTLPTTIKPSPEAGATTCGVPASTDAPMSTLLPPLPGLPHTHSRVRNMTHSIPNTVHEFCVCIFLKTQEYHLLELHGIHRFCKFINQRQHVTNFSPNPCSLVGYRVTPSLPMQPLGHVQIYGTTTQPHNSVQVMRAKFCRSCTGWSHRWPQASTRIQRGCKQVLTSKHANEYAAYCSAEPEKSTSTTSAQKDL